MAKTNILYYIRKGFYDKLIPSGTNTFKTSVLQTVSGTSYYKLYHHLAPQVIPGTKTDVTLPYVVYDTLPITQERDSAVKWYRCMMQFVVAGSSQSEAEDVAGYLTDLLEDSEASLSFTGYTTLGIFREPMISQGFIEGVWNIVVQYSIIIQP